MDILTTRLLNYLDEVGSAKDLVLTIFAPQSVDGAWKCGFLLPDPFRRKNVESYGVDYIQALILCLQIVPSYLRLCPVAKRLHWHGMRHFGLPNHAERPADYQAPEIGAVQEYPGGMAILTTRTVGCLDQHGTAYPITLTLYKPFQVDDGEWKCAFSFGPLEEKRISVRYGIGADFIESLLDALSLARATYETFVPTGWHPKKSEDWLDCADLPFKIGRAFHTDIVGDLGPGAPDFTPS